LNFGSIKLNLYYVNYIVTCHRYTSITFTQSLALAENSDLLYERSYLNIEGKRRKNTYIQLDQRIKKTLAEYEVDKNLVKCLNIIANI